MSGPEDVPAPATAPLSRIPFTARDEQVLRSLSVWMKIAAVINLINGVVNAVNVVYPRLNPGKAIEAVVAILVGVWVWQAAGSFHKVATTDRADQDYLVEGFTRLRRVFLLQSILIIIALALVCALLLLFVLAMLARGAR